MRLDLDLKLVEADVADQSWVNTTRQWWISAMVEGLVALWTGKEPVKSRGEIGSGIKFAFSLCCRLLPERRGCYRKGG
ncbi:hypothetical protein CKO42_12845 [Lamprobacter modestohalophilus]|uniref:Uncharacterized protein n=1 Tax=Lamprobacter modestohalophilus TaxID=1064514 RepID=A0A9X0WAG4_9GAMM|nr:hypothetical protein [Lamprobacter modestohalophilus]